MNQVFYLEPDEEITKVIDRIKKSEKDGVVLVIPRGSTISKSIINLKLLLRSAKEKKKAIALVSTDKVTKNLADQLGLDVFAKPSEAENADLSLKGIPENDVQEGSLKVNTYRKYDLSHISAFDGEEDAEESDEDEATDQIGDQEDEASGGEDETNQPESSENYEEADDEPDDNLTKESDISEEDKDIVKKSADPEIKEDETPLIHKPRKLKTRGSRRIIIALGGFAVFVLLLASYFYFSKAEASLVLTTSDSNKKATIQVDKNQGEVDASALKIPGKIVQVDSEITKEFDATGKKDAGEKAKGTITISNSISTKAITISPGAEVVSEDGKVFKVEKGVLVPGATLENCEITPSGINCDRTPGTVETTVIASQNGDQYNLAPTTFTVNGLAAANKDAFAGGITKNILYVTEKDLANAEDTIKKEALSSSKSDLINKADQEGQKIFGDDIALEISSLEPNKNVNDEVNKFQIKATVSLSALGFSENDLRTAMVSIVSNDLKPDQMLVGTEESNLSYKLTASSLDDGYVKVEANYKGKVGTKIEISDIQNKIRNMADKKAEEYLKGLSGVKAATVESLPGFLNRTPFLSNHIKVNFTYEK